MKYIILSVLFHVIASVLLKLGAISIENFSIIEIALNGFYILSIVFLFLKAIVWQISLKHYDLNFAYLFTSAYYPIILLLSFFMFDEKITLGNIIGTLFIVLGIIHLTRKDKNA